jgi:hypothetical protein
MPLVAGNRLDSLAGGTTVLKNFSDKLEQGFGIRLEVVIGPADSFLERMAAQNNYWHGAVFSESVY